MKATRLAAALVSALVSFVGVSIPAASGDTVRLKFGYVQPVGHPNHRTAQTLAAKIDKYSGGKMALELYPASQLGGERDLLEGLRLGTVQMYLGSSAVASQFVPEFSLFELPYLVKDFAHAERIWKEALASHVSPKSEKVGFKVLGIYDAGERGIGTSKRITKLADLKGLRIRTMESKISIESYKALGAIATPIPFPDLIPAITQGVVDGADYALQTYLQGKVYQAAPYFIHIGMSRMAGILAISQDAWNKLPGTLREATERAVSESLAEQPQLLEELVKKFDAEAKQSKFPFAHSYPDVSPFREAARSVYTQFEKHVGGKQSLERVLAVK